MNFKHKCQNSARSKHKSQYPVRSEHKWIKCQYPVRSKHKCQSPVRSDNKCKHTATSKYKCYQPARSPKKCQQQTSAGLTCGQKVTFSLHCLSGMALDTLTGRERGRSTLLDTRGQLTYDLRTTSAYSEYASSVQLRYVYCSAPTPSPTPLH